MELPELQRLEIDAFLNEILYEKPQIDSCIDPQIDSRIDPHIELIASQEAYKLN